MRPLYPYAQVILGMVFACGWPAAFAQPSEHALPPETQGTPTGAALSRDTVISLADTAASKGGYTLLKYQRPHVYFNFMKGDTRLWTLFYEGIQPTPPGSGFMVLVDDRTGFVKVIPGE